MTLDKNREYEHRSHSYRGSISTTIHQIKTRLKLVIRRNA